jgi:hypothetical protein
MIAQSLQKKILLSLLGLWIAVFGVMYLWGSQEDKGSTAPAVRKNAPPKTAPVKGRGYLDLIPWEREPEPLAVGAHNPFHPLAGYMEPPPTLAASKAKAPPPPPPDPYMEELKTFKYFGFAQDEKKTVAFMGKGASSYTVKEKDIIENKFLVKRITEDYVVIGEPKGPKELTISQSGFGEAGPGSPGAVRPPAPLPAHQPPFPPRPTFTPPPRPTTPPPPPTPSEKRIFQPQRPTPTRPQLPKEGEQP